MADNTKNRVKFTTTTTGTGSIADSGAVSGFQRLSAFADGDSATFTVVDANGAWETFKGTVGASGTTVTRGTLEDSSTGSVLTLSAGTHSVFQGGSAREALNSIILSRGLKRGLAPRRVSSTTLGVISGGSCHIESLDRIVSGAPADIVPSSPSANSWYHVYAYVNSGVLTLEASTTAPVAYASAVGNARSKSGDASRRYLYSAKTDGSGNFYNFAFDEASGYFAWIGSLGSGIFRVLVNGTAGSPTAVDCSSCVGPTARTIAGGFSNTGAGSLFVSTNDTTVSPSNFSIGVGGGGFSAANCPVDSSQRIQYLATSGGIYIDVNGFFMAS